MKGSTVIITNLIIFAIGILLLAVFRQRDFVHTIIIITGVLFIVPGIINVFSLVREKNKPLDDPTRRTGSAKVLGWITCCAALVLGITMVAIPEAYREVFVYIFAITLTLGAIYHYYMMLRGLRPARFNWWLYIFPTLILGAAAAIFFIPSLKESDGQSTVILLTGIALVLFAIMSFIEGAVWRRVAKQLQLHDKAQTEASSQRAIEDVNAEDV